MPCSTTRCSGARWRSRCSWADVRRPVARAVGSVTRRVPRGSWLLADMLLDWVSQDPKPSASVLQGLFYGRVAPPARSAPR